MSIKKLFNFFYNFKPLKFLLIGGTTFVIYYAVLYLVREFADLKNNIGLSIAYLTSVTFHFLANKLFVFQEKKLSTINFQIIKYIIMAGINYLINLGVVNLLGSFGISVYIGVAAATVITLSLTYFVMNKFIFKPNENNPENK